MISVYKIKNNKTNEIVYIGESKDLYKRWSWHTNKYGNFNKIDFCMEVVKEFDNRIDARKYERLLKEQFGFEITEETRSKKGNTRGILGGKIVSNIVHTCPNCGISAKGIGYYRWHGDKCKK
jgi:predicted GIY-YIG superfamily endonuclease